LIVRDIIFNKLYLIWNKHWTQPGHKYGSYDKFTRDCQRVAALTKESTTVNIKINKSEISIIRLLISTVMRLNFNLPPGLKRTFFSKNKLMIMKMTPNI
jgi:hypothetical protein